MRLHIKLIGEVETGQTPDSDLSKFLTEHGATDLRMAGLLEETQFKYTPHSYIGPPPGYSPPPGIPRTFTLRKYTCPEPDCNCAWERRHRGEKIPECPIHKVPLQRL